MLNQESHWIKETYRQHFDLIILGNGFTGMQSALQIKKKYPQKSIAIVDQSYISKGASLRNAGFACFGSVGEILDDLQSTPESEVFELVNMRFTGLQYLQEDFSDIDYRNGNALELFLPSEEQHYHLCIEKLDWVNEQMKPITGIPETYHTQSHHYNTSFRPLAIANPAEGHIHTGKLYHRMQQKVIAAGIFWIGDFKVNRFEKVNDLFEVRSTQQELIKADAVVSCLNAFTSEILNDEELVPARGQIIVTQALANNPIKGILHADKGYIYARDIGDRILIGGGRNIDAKTEETCTMETNLNITQYLLNFVNEKLLMNETTAIEHTWSGIMGMAPQKGAFPIIKEEQTGFWSCYRLGGMGVALSSVIARKVAERI